MPEQIFIGREDNLKLFDEVLTSPIGSPYILNLRGVGGMGKTKISERFIEVCENNNIPHTSIIDFYNPELVSHISSVELTIIQDINGDTFLNYLELHEQYPNRTPIQTKKLTEAFVIGLSEWANHVLKKTGKRGVIIFDTFEQVKDNNVGYRIINDWLPHLNSAVVILSGRQLEGEIKFLPKISNLVIDVPVDEFTDEEAIAYFKSRRVWSAIQEAGVINRLLELASRRPLRLALSADWIYQNPASLNELVAENITKNIFERTLVEGLQRVDIIPKPENLVLPFMAHIVRPFDIELLDFLEIPNVSSDNAKSILDNLSQLSFVKYRVDEDNDSYWLQDELRTLIEVYIFEANPATWDPLRKLASQKMVEFYNNKANNAKLVGDTHSEQLYKSRELYNKIYLDPVNAFKEFNEVFQKARVALQYDYSSLLIGAVRLGRKFLEETERFQLDIAEGRWWRDIGNTQLAETRFWDLLEQYGHMPNRAIFIYNALGVSLRYSGRFNEALEFHTKGLDLRKQLGKYDALDVEERNIGEVYQLMGRLDEAIHHFNLARELALQHEKWINVVDIEAALGFAHGLLGEYEAGIDYCNQAINLAENLNQPLLSAKTKILRSDIYRRMGDYYNRHDYYEIAIKDIQESIPEFHETDAQNSAKAYFFLGYTKWYESKYSIDTSVLNEIRELLETAISKSQENNLILNLPEALHEISQIYWALGLKDKARQANDESYIIATEVYYIQYALNSLLKKAEFDYEDGHYDNVIEYAKTIETDFEQKNYEYPLFYGRIRRILGDINLQQANYDEAERYYGEGLYLIALHGGYGRYKLSEELQRLQAKLDQIDAKVALDIYLGLKNFWLKKELRKNKVKMMSWVDSNISRFTYQINFNKTT